MTTTTITTTTSTTTTTTTTTPTTTSTTTTTTTTTPTTTEPAATTTTAVPTTQATLPPTTAPPPPPTQLAAPTFTNLLEPGTKQVNSFLDFAGSHLQQVVVLNVAFTDTGQPSFAIDTKQEPLYLFACSGPPNEFSQCGDGFEVLISDLKNVPDASVVFEHGTWAVRGRFAVQALSGPHMGILSIALRAVPIQ